MNRVTFAGLEPKHENSPVQFSSSTKALGRVFTARYNDLLARNAESYARQLIPGLYCPVESSNRNGLVDRMIDANVNGALRQVAREPTPLVAVKCGVRCREDARVVLGTEKKPPEVSDLYESGYAKSEADNYRAPQRSPTIRDR